MTIRSATHAGSWYTDNASTLMEQLQAWLNQVDAHPVGLGHIPIPGARVIIAPHAGYAYSGPAAAWAYKSLDISQAKRIFLLGPSHKYPFSTCALSKHTHYSTPMGDIPLDLATIQTLRSTNRFTDMSSSTDSAEHSLEMHLPYIYHICRNSYAQGNPPPLVPILVGSTSATTEKAFGALLAPYLADPTNVFIISSDFCHWGARFEYTYYLPSSTQNPAKGVSLRKRDEPDDPPVNESIARIDKLAIEGIESGQHETFLATLRATGNTVCGRHPIGVIMAAIEALKKDGGLDQQKGFFKFVRYERSSEVYDGSDSSVSYASAFAVL